MVMLIALSFYIFMPPSGGFLFPALHIRPGQPVFLQVFAQAVADEAQAWRALSLSTHYED